MPKSATSAWLPVSRMFSGFTSRWIMPSSVGVAQRVGRFARDPERVLHRELGLAREAVAKTLPRG